jgi:hypothetical protein
VLFSHSADEIFFGHIAEGQLRTTVTSEKKTVGNIDEEIPQ